MRMRSDPSLRLLRRRPDFGWFWMGQSAAAIGGQVTALALPLISAVSLRAGPGQVGVVATAAWLPYLLFSLLAGHWLEGRDHRRSMIAAEALQIAALASIPLAALLDLLSIAWLAAAAFVAACGALIVGLGGFTYVTQLVETDELAPANRALQGSRTVAQVGGPGLAGALVGGLGPAAALLIDALGHIVSLFGLAKSGAPETSRPTARERPPLIAGLRLLFSDPYLRSLTVHAAIYNLAYQVFSLNLVLYAVSEASVSPQLFGLALAGSGVGAVIGTLIALHLSDRWGLGPAFAGSLVLSCCLPVLIAVVPWTGTALAVVIGLTLLVAGIGLGNANIYSLTLRQNIIPTGLLTRTAGSYTQIMYGSIPIGSATAGLVGAQAGTRVGVLAGALGLAGSALPVFLGRIRSLRDPARAAQEVPA